MGILDIDATTPVCIYRPGATPAREIASTIRVHTPARKRPVDFVLVLESAIGKMRLNTRHCGAGNQLQYLFPRQLAPPAIKKALHGFGLLGKSLARQHGNKHQRSEVLTRGSTHSHSSRDTWPTRFMSGHRAGHAVGAAREHGGAKPSNPPSATPVLPFPNYFSNTRLRIEASEVATRPERLPLTSWKMVSHDTPPLSPLKADPGTASRLVSTYFFFAAASASRLVSFS